MTAKQENPAAKRPRPPAHGKPLLPAQGSPGQTASKTVVASPTLKPEAIKLDIHKEFAEHSVAEFFKKNRQMLGYSGKIKSLTTLVHEYVTNSIDACEEARIAPDIFVKIEQIGLEHYKVIVEDNGPGIPKKIIGKALGKMLAGTKFNRFQQARGQQGIGAAGCVMYGQITTGKPTKVVTSSGSNTIYEADLTLDTKTNEPKVANEKEYPGHMRGLRIETEVKDVIFQNSDQNAFEYLRRTALANPHVKITFISPDNITTVWDRAVSQMPKPPKPTLPHPKGITTDDLLSMASRTTARSVKSFLTTEFTRMSSQKANEIQGKVSFDMEKRAKDMTWEEAEQVVNAVKQLDFIAPPTDVLIPIGEDHLSKALDSVLKPEYKCVITRSPSVYRGGVPFIVEIGLAYGGKAGRQIEAPKEGDAKEIDRMEIMRFANRVPLLFDSGSCALTQAVQSIDWKRYDIRPEIPITVIVNFTSIYVPYTGAGKQAVSDEEEVVKDIRLAIMDAARSVGRYVSGQARKYDREEKMKMLLLYVEPVAEAISTLTGKPQKVLEKKIENLIETKFGEYVDSGEDENDVKGNNGEPEEAGSEAAD